MTIKIFTSNEQRKRAKDLLQKDIPTYRQAYSDRTAWIMACLSELAYLKFNPPFPEDRLVKPLIEGVSKVLLDGRRESLMQQLIEKYTYDHDEEKKRLEQKLEEGLQLKCVKTFDKADTQAILVLHEKLKFIALAFRGTEKESVKDIKTDCKAITKICDSGGKIHRGFSDAFEAVAEDIQKQLDDPEYSEFPLFITGHSLGGALATIAAKRLSHEEGGIAACYTFGAPRVGDDIWISSIKTPIYRVVNAADGVTLLPPGDEIVSSFACLFKFISYFDIPIISPLCKGIQVWLLSKLGGYMHSGDMRYLSNCDSGNYEDVKLLPNVTFFRRIKMIWHKKSFWKKFLLDHSISIYRKKLMVIAEKHNQLV